MVHTDAVPIQTSSTSDHPRMVWVTSFPDIHSDNTKRSNQKFLNAVTITELPMATGTGTVRRAKNNGIRR